MASNSKSGVAFILVNIALFAFVSATNASCPDLNVCVNIKDSLLNVQFGSQAKSDCCTLLAGVVNGDAAVCLCNSLKTTTLGNTLGSSLGLLTGGLVGSLTGGLTGSILDNEILAVFNACGLNTPTNYKCAI